MATNNSTNSSFPVPITLGGTNTATLTDTDGIVFFDGTELATTTVGTAGQVLTSNGTGVAPTFQASGGGGSPTFTNLTLTGNLNLANTSSSSAGVITVGGQPFFSVWSDFNAPSNIFLGNSAGNFTGMGSPNYGIGDEVFDVLANGANNIGIGFNSLSALVNGNGNVFLGHNTALSLTGSNNCGIGLFSLGQLVGGSGNVCMGSSSGVNYTASESNNVLISNEGVASESNAIHIGTVGTQTTAFIAGVFGVTTALGGLPVNVDSTGKLGTTVSSARFKENINDMNNASEALLRLRPVTFTYKDRPSEVKNYGLIAEEVEQIFPDLVVYDDQGSPLSVRYNDIPVILLNEFKKLIKRVQILEKELEH